MRRMGQWGGKKIFPSKNRLLDQKSLNHPGMTGHLGGKEIFPSKNRPLDQRSLNHPGMTGHLLFHFETVQNSCHEKSSAVFHIQGALERSPLTIVLFKQLNGTNFTKKAQSNYEWKQLPELN